MDDALPTTLGRFRIEALLGRGAMGIVYKAHDPHIERTVALKLIRADLLDGESRERYLARFRNEARVAGRCVHPNIIGLYDFALHEGNPYLVMEYVDGMDLGRAFPRGQATADGIIVQIALQVLDALGYAHAFGIIHRDIKPANILRTADGRLKVTDFGISRFAFDSTQSAVMVGTPSYMSPEQCRGLPLDQRCDLFSLGCVLYELSSGERAFGGASYAETLYKLIHEPHVPLATRNPAVSQQLSEIVDRALAKQPEDRFETALDMATALRGLIGTALPPSGQAHEVLDEPATIILPAGSRSLSGTRAGTSTSSILNSIDVGSLATLERQLASHMGPMAGYHLRRVLRDAQSTEEFHQLVSNLVPKDSPQQSMVRDALHLVTARGATANGTDEAVIVPEPPLAPPAPQDGISDEFLAGVTRAMMQVMGPIAPRLVAKARTRATARPELVASCAEMIDRPDERARFRALLKNAE
jgi:eukaryotic-like serine/threonine-protein kinase